MSVPFKTTRDLQVKKGFSEVFSDKIRKTNFTMGYNKEVPNSEHRIVFCDKKDLGEAAHPN